MPILRIDDARPAIKDAVVLDLGDLGAQAAKLRAAAESKAMCIIADAEQKAAELVRGADAKGFEQGLARGLEQGLEQGREQGRAEALQQSTAQLNQLQASWSQLATDWDQARIAMHNDAQRAVIDFATRFAELLIHRIVEVDPGVIVDQIANALSMVLRPHDVTIRIHPADRPLVEEALPQIKQQSAELDHVHLVDDQTVSRGGCVLSYGQGEVDAQLDTQVRRVLEMIVPDKSPSQDQDTTEQDPPPSEQPPDD